ncbi:MAG: hypothetical protein ACOYMH_10780, partial [Zwartia sp.]
AQTFKGVYQPTLCALPTANGSTYFISAYNQKKYNTAHVKGIYCRALCAPLVIAHKIAASQHLFHARVQA